MLLIADSMNAVLVTVLMLAAVGIGVWLASFIIEAIRPAPTPPATLRWAPRIPIQSIEVCGNRLRFIKTGNGPNLVLPGSQEAPRWK
jgi:hypothetical protein